MNAYKLASFLEADSWYKLVSRYEIVDMLRQQADRIAELEKDLHMIERHYDQLNKDVSSKPVAWGVQSDGDWTEMFWDEKELDELEDFYGQQGWNYEVVPLYTHPVKQLSDEEIFKAEYKFMDWNRGLEKPLVQIASELFVFRQALAIIKEITQ